MISQRYNYKILYFIATKDFSKSILVHLLFFCHSVIFYFYSFQSFILLNAFRGPCLNHWRWDIMAKYFSDQLVVIKTKLRMHGWWSCIVNFLPFSESSYKQFFQFLHFDCSLWLSLIAGLWETLKYEISINVQCQMTSF